MSRFSGNGTAFRKNMTDSTSAKKNGTSYSPRATVLHSRASKLALTELGLIDEYEFVVHPRLAGHGPTLFAGLLKHVDLKLVGRLAFDSGAVAMRYIAGDD